MKIGIIDWHGDFTNIMKLIIPDSDTVTVYHRSTTHIDDQIDILLNGDTPYHNDRFPFNFFAVPYSSVTENYINDWNSNPRCIGVLDLSNSLKKRFPSLKKPVWGYLPSVLDLPVYKESGTKVITMVNVYKERFPEEYELAKTITNNIYGLPDNSVNDIEALKDTKWLLHIKRNGFVCNAIIKALACGVPVIVDTETYTNTFLENLIQDKVNGIVLPVDQIKGYLETVDDATYAQIKANCVAQADKFRHPVKWADRWWEQKTGGSKRAKARGGFVPSVMGGVMRLGPTLMAAGMAQGSRLLSRKEVRKGIRRRSTRRVKRRSRRS